MTAGSEVDVDSAGRRVTAELPRAFKELRDLVALESVFDGAAGHASHCETIAEWLRDAYLAEGLPDARLHRMSDGSVSVLARRPAAAGLPTVLLYAHHDVQPADQGGWTSPPFRLTKRGGRWYGRGAADCKGNLVAQLVALRVLRMGDDPGGVGLTVVSDGSEERGTGGLEQFVLENPDHFADADVMLVMDAGNESTGQPAITTSLRSALQVDVTVYALERPIHSGMYAGPTPDAVAALAHVLASFRDAVTGDVSVVGIEGRQAWRGSPYPDSRARGDLGLLGSGRVLGSGSIADHLWARPTVTVVGIDVPSVASSTPTIQATASARLDVRLPPDQDVIAAQNALVAHVAKNTPWGLHADVASRTVGRGFSTDSSGPMHTLLAGALADSFQTSSVSSRGDGGTIPVCGALRTANHEAEILLCGVEEPRSNVHGEDESVDEGVLAMIATTLVLFIKRLAATPEVTP